jgi:hypothetical protein
VTQQTDAFSNFALPPQQARARYESKAFSDSVEAVVDHDGDHAHGDGDRAAGQSLVCDLGWAATNF